jgi:hypothetical protein
VEGHLWPHLGSRDQNHGSLQFPEQMEVEGRLRQGLHEGEQTEKSPSRLMTDDLDRYAMRSIELVLGLTL